MITLDEAAHQIRSRYPTLTADEACQVARLERDYPGWHIWPKVGYPDGGPPGWYARRIGTSPPALLRVSELPRVAGAIEAWLDQHAGPWPRAGQPGH